MNFKKTILSITLAMAIIAPTVVYAQSLNNVTTDASITSSQKKAELKTSREEKITARNEKLQQKQEKLETRIARHEKIFKNADLIVPGTLDKGMAVLNQRIELRGQISDIRKAKRDAVILPIKEQLKADVDAIKQQLTKGEITKEVAKVKLQELQQEKKTKIQDIRDGFKKQYEAEKAALKVKRETVHESFKNFATAVKSKDATTIENTFNIYLQNANELNTMLKGLISKITA